ACCRPPDVARPTPRRLRCPAGDGAFSRVRPLHAVPGGGSRAALAPRLLLDREGGWGAVGWGSRRAASPGAEAVRDRALLAAVRGLVVATAREAVGQVVLLHDGLVVVVRVAVALPVAEALHERRGRVPEVQWDGERTLGPHVLGGGEHGAIGRV